MTEPCDPKRLLCRLDELPAQGCREFRLGQGEWPLRCFVVRVPDGVRAYVNQCAHVKYPLNYLPHEFLTPDRAFIRCYVHNALFEKDNGYCVVGPCAGLSLISVPIRVMDDCVWLADGTDPDEFANRYA